MKTPRNDIGRMPPELLIPIAIASFAAGLLWPVFQHLLHPKQYTQPAKTEILTRASPTPRPAITYVSPTQRAAATPSAQ